MNRWRARSLRAAFAALVALLTLSSEAGAQPAGVQISIGVRETGVNAPIGFDGGTSGGIEWIDRDEQTLVLDGTWQQFTFHLPTADVLAFAGATANSILEGDVGTLEHIRIKSLGQVTGPIAIWIDDLIDTVHPQGFPAPIPVIVQDWEAFDPGEEVTFNQPGFSGSTSNNLENLPDIAEVDDQIPHAGDHAYRIEFQFVDLDPSRWVRLTTSFVDNQPNPTIAFNNDSTITFWMRGCVCTPACPADFVTSKTFQPPPDGVVDAADLAFLLGQWGNSVSPADIVTSATFAPPPDGTVDAADLAVLLGEWGGCK